MKTLVGVLIFLCISLKWAFPEAPPVWWQQVAGEAGQDGYVLLTPKMLQQIYDSKKPFLIVDVRAGYEYADGHLPQAVCFEFDLGDKLALKPEKQNAFEKLLGADKKRKIIFYCRSFR